MFPNRRISHLDGYKLAISRLYTLFSLLVISRELLCSEQGISLRTAGTKQRICPRTGRGNAPLPIIEGIKSLDDRLVAGQRIPQNPASLRTFVMAQTCRMGHRRRAPLVRPARLSAGCGA